MIGYGDIFVLIYLSYLVMYFLHFAFSKTNMEEIQRVNKRLEELRKIPIKTVEEQKEFINLRYPKTKWKFSWKWLGGFVLNLFFFLVAFNGILVIFWHLNIHFKLWQGLLFITFIPIFVNLFLRKFGLHQQDITVFFR